MTSSSHPRWVLLIAAVLVILPVALVLVVTWPAASPPDPVSANLARAAPAVGLLLAILLGGALALLFLALAETARGGPPSLETSWGGFGGGLGGWHLSPALTYLLLAIFLGGLFGVMAGRVVDSPAFHRWAGVPEPDARELVSEEDEPPGEAANEDETAEGEVDADEPVEGDGSEAATPAAATGD